MKTPHIHADIIKAWADGAEIEFQEFLAWRPTKTPQWHEGVGYRIKPESKPDIVSYVYARGGIWLHFCEEEDCEHNIKLTFDGETGKVKSAEVIE
jgi:hypothetical protein